MSISSYTNNYKFGLIDYNSQGWHDDEHANWLIADSAISAIASPAVVATYSSGGGTAAWAYTATGVVAYTAGMRIIFKATFAPTLATQTININGLGAKSLYMTGYSNLNDVNNIRINDVVELFYDGTKFAMLRPVRQVSTFEINSAVAYLSLFSSGIAPVFQISIADRTLTPKIQLISGFAAGDTTLNVYTNSLQAKASIEIADALTTTVIESIELSSTDLYSSVKKIRFNNKDLGTKFILDGNTTNGEVFFGFLAGATNGFKVKRAGGVEMLVPIKMMNYTVATLPAAATYIYHRAMVSDANATTFNSIVAGGGANKIPVYSDGVNWRIG